MLWQVSTILKKNMILSQIAEIKTNFPEADFWIIRKGLENKVGSPTRKFNTENIGIKIISNNLLPDYLYYAIDYIHSIGYFKSICSGATRLKHIRVSDIKNIKLG